MFSQKSSTEQCASNSKHHVEPRVFYTTHSSDFQVGASTKLRHLRGGWDPDTVHVFLEIPHSLVNLKKNLRLACRFHTPSSQRRKLCLPPTPCYPSRMPLAALGNPWWRSRHRVPACILLRRGLSLDIGFTMHHTHHHRHPSCALPTAGLPTGTRYTDLSLLCWSTDITSSTKTAIHRPLATPKWSAPVPTNMSTRRALLSRSPFLKQSLPDIND